MIYTTKESIIFNYSSEDEKLFTDNQKEYWKNIIHFYEKIRSLCLSEIQTPIESTHKKWITSRVNLHTTTSLTRLLYLTESFSNSALDFNSVAAAIHIKAMTEIPLHLGYIVWVLDSHHSFNEIREQLAKIAFGNRNNGTGLTVSSKISHKEMYTKTDEIMTKLFKNNEHKMNMFESLYKDANAIGHHNHESHNMLIGLRTDETWRIKDRKEWFVFWSNNIFQFFLYCNTILTMSWVLMDAINYYLTQLPEYFPDKGIETKSPLNNK